MKIVVTAREGKLESEVDPRFGRARYFIVVDTESEEFEVMDNEQNLNAMGGAGVQAAQNVVGAGAEAVVTGNVGPKAFTGLTAAGIKVYVGAAGTVAEAVEKYKAGELSEAGDANVEGRWA